METLHNVYLQSVMTWSNISTWLDAHILFQHSKIAQRKFMQRLAEELRVEFMEGKRAAWQLAWGPSQQQKKLPAADAKMEAVPGSEKLQSK